jgi:hypothetical protein
VQRLVVPAIIHDCKDKENLPRFIGGIIPAELQEYSNVRTARDSVTEEKLSSLIRDWVPDISKAIQRAPPFDASWVELAIEEFIALFSEVPAPKQRIAPSLAAVP